MSKCKHFSKSTKWSYIRKTGDTWACSKCKKSFANIQEAMAVGVGLDVTIGQTPLTDQEKLDYALDALNKAREVLSGWDSPEGSYTSYECEGCYQKNRVIDDVLLRYKWDDLKKLSTTEDTDFRLRGLLEELRREIIYRTGMPYPTEDYLSILTAAVNYIKSMPRKK